MKRILLPFIFLIFLSQMTILNAQVFNWQADTTMRYVSPSSAPTTVFFPTYIHNVSTDSIHLRACRISTDLPADWSSSLCYQFCYPPFVDTVNISIAASEVEEIELNMNITNVSAVGTVTLKLENIDNPAEYETKDFVVSTQPNGITDEPEMLSGRFRLLPNYPNPFNPSTRIPFEINAGGPEKTSLAVYNIVGQRVRVLVDDVMQPGYYEVTWNGTNDRGERLESGVYFYQLKSGKKVRMGKMVMMK